MGLLPGLRERVLGALRQPTTAELLRHVALPYLVQRTLLLLIVFFGAVVSTPQTGWHALPECALLDGWLRFDSQYYQLIATKGYGWSEWGNADGFFPLYPALLWLFAHLMPLPYAALLVAHAAAVGALCMLYLLARREQDGPFAQRVIWIVLLFPTSFFLSAAYSESTYLLVGAGAVLFWRARRPWPAAALAALAVLARPVGAFCFTLPFVLGWLIRSRRWRDLPWLVAGAGVGTGCVLLIYQAFTGDPLAFLNAPTVRSLRVFWHHESVPWGAVLQDEGINRNLMRRILNWSAVALVFGTSVHLFIRRDVELGLLSLTALAVPLFFHGGPFDSASMARYALASFPMFFILARWAPDGIRAKGYDVGAQMLQVILALMFVSWRWAE